jgi:hypothetical protein
VSTDSATGAWAVGYYDTNSTTDEPSLILHWNGTSWTQISSPDPGGTGESLLNGVSAISANDAWAVGSYNTDPSTTTSDSQSLILHWNGKSWTKVSSPS